MSDGSIEIRKAESKDIDVMVGICKALIPVTYGDIMTEEVLEPWVKGDKVETAIEELLDRTFLAMDRGDVVGIIANTENYIEMLWVPRAHQRKGIGMALVRYVEDMVRPRGHRTLKIHCFKDNLGAVAFYTSLGYLSVDEEIDNEAGIPKLMLAKDL
jgi:GNAT superfamily N-acetyltransferase